jgi:putative membrane protein
MQLHWHTEPLFLILFVLAGILYGLAAGPLRHRLTMRAKYPRLPVFCLILGLFVLYGAIASPLDALGEHYLFSAHMLQHIILIYPVPMLLLMGLPAWMLRPFKTRFWVERIVRCLTRPVVTLSAFNLVFMAWHIPGLYEWALRDRLVHNLEHVTFLLTALFIWWPILSPLPTLPRLPWGSQIVYLFTLSISQIPVFAYITFTDEVLYPTYEIAARIVPLTPLEDQQLGGIIMKVASMIVLFGMLAVAFWRGYQVETSRQSLLTQPEPSTV